MKPDDFVLSLFAPRPRAQAEDAVKWAFQNAFGCGHILPEEAECAQSIRLEMQQAVPDAAEPAYEPLGNGLCRLNLHSPQVRRLPPERLARMMRVTAEQFHASPERFEDNLSLLRSLAARCGANIHPASGETRLPFTLPELNAAIERYRAAGGLPSHSAAYRDAYRPAYRVVLRRYGEPLPILCEVENRLADSGRATLVIDGDCASGKTTLAALLAPLYDCNVFHMDDFFLPPALRTSKRLAQPGGNVHWERFLAQVLSGLLSGEPFPYGAFDCHTGRTETVAVTPKPVALIEGSYALHPAFQEAYAKLRAVKVLLTVSSAQQRLRIVARNGKALWPRFENDWIPLEKQYFEAYHKDQGDQMTLQSCSQPEDEPQQEAERP